MKSRLLIKKMGALFIMAAMLIQVAALPAVPVNAAETVTPSAGTVVEAVREGSDLPVAPAARQEKIQLMPGLIDPAESMKVPAEAMKVPALTNDLKGKDVSGFQKLDPDEVSAEWHENTIPALAVTEDSFWNGYEGSISYDIYVAPDTILIITGDALLDANLYNYGLVIVSGSLSADYIYSNSYYSSIQSVYYNGDLMLDEEVYSEVWAYEFYYISDVATVPIAMYSGNEVTRKGYLPVLQGAIMPVYSLSLENAPVPLYDNGSFTYYDYYVGSKTALSFILTDYFGQRYTFSYPLTQLPYVAPSVKVLAGQTRYNTAQQISSAMYDYASTAILVRADDFPDALAAGPLAYAWDAPILLTASNQLNEVTRQELVRLGVSKVILMGGPLSISNAVKADLERTYTVERIAGDTRYTTAITAANRLKEYWGSPSTIVMTSGVNFPDALAAGSYAASNGYPLILTNGTNVLQHDLDFIQTNRVTRVILMGSSNVISTAVENLLKNRGLTIERVAGGTRADTSAVMAKKYFAGAEEAVAANGWTFADALTAIPYAASLGAPILLVRQDYVELSVRNFLSGSGIHTISVVGGDQVVSPGVRSTLLKSIQ